MTASRKPTARQELERIERALLRSILDADEHELREELDAFGDAADAYVVEIREAIARAKEICSTRRLDAARADRAAWQASNDKVSPPEVERARKRWELLRGGNGRVGQEMTLAARKGDGLSDRDVEGLLKDLADLSRLEDDQDK